MTTKLQVTSSKLKVGRLLIILITGILCIGVTAWATKPAELPSGVTIIKPMDKANNPYQKEYDEMLAPTVMIETLTGCGSGVVIPSSIVQQLNSSKETYILTAAHVVGKYAKVEVTFYNYDNSTFNIITASVVMTDTSKDLALLRVLCDLSGEKIYPAKLAKRDYKPYLFAEVWVVGCSLGLDPRPSFGHLCALAVDSWEVSAPVLPGNSGGPVYAKRSAVPSNDGNAYQYELIGIAVWVRLYGDQLITTMAGIVPISEIYNFLDQRTKEPKDERTLNSSSVFPFLSSSVRQSDASRCLSVSMRGREMYRRIDKLMKYPYPTETGSGPGTFGRDDRTCLICRVGTFGDTTMSTVKLWIKLAVNPLTTAVPKMAELWANGLSNNADKLIDRIKTTIPDEITYLSRIAEPAEQEFRKVLDPAFISRKGKNKNRINATQAYKIKQAWARYLKNLEYMFENVDGVAAKRFKDKVQASKDAYADRLSETTLALTGVKALESGPARIAVFWLSGDSKAKGLMRAADQYVAASEPFNVTTMEKRNSLRSLLFARLIQGGITIIHAGMGMPVITEVNTLLNSLVQGMIDPMLGLESFTPGGASHVDFIKDNGQLFLEVKVSQV
ncbi:MAG: trypsin-like peptidase domain-containing protein [Planctomycetes bacterium]|nr:trypsin-like peptidase domain-containing protein [Planctomycetota bacterium]